jgi:hypothetical protein
VPAAVTEMIAGDLDLHGASRNIAALEAVGRVTRDDDGTVRLPRFLDHNPTRAKVEADREAMRKRQAESRARRRRPEPGP